MSHIEQKKTYLDGSLRLPEAIEKLEHKHISERRKNCRIRFNDAAQKQSSATDNDPKESLTGLAISGGGIRSASFALGVMQALESDGLMKRFDYLSTVSGGGYIGGSFSWFLNRNSKKKTGDLKFKENEYPWPWGTDDPDLTNACNDNKTEDSQQQKDYLDYFRQHGEYLIPGNGITRWSLVSVIIRAVFLNLLVYVPLITTLITFFLIALTARDTFILGSPPEVIKSFMYPLYNVQQNVMSAWMLVGAGLIALFGGLIALAYSVSTRLARRLNFSASKYKFRRITEEYSGYALVLFIVFFLAGLLPVLNQLLYDLTAGMNLGWSNGILVPVVGLMSALFPLYKLFRKQFSLSIEIFIQIAVTLLILGLLLSTYNMAFFSISQYGETSGFSLACNEVHCYQAYEVMQAFLSVEILSIPYFWSILLALSLLSGFVVNLNYISIHRFYRDRLMEAYMQEVPVVLKGKTTSAKHSDHLKIHDLYNDDEQTIAPYHLINTNVILVNDDNKKYKNRGGDSFVISPGYCGSTATGWNTAEHFMNNKMTLPTAVAISGAAANPNTAPGGKGLTRSRSVSLLMSLFNLRLGYWVPHPKGCENIFGQRRVTPNHFRAALYEAGMDADKESAYVQLSDGGHFENLAVYELIRRRCRVIVLSDAAADPGFGFSDLQILLRRIEQDFNTTIVFKGDNELEQMIPSIKKRYPKKLKVAKRGFVIGEIKYPDVEEKSYLIYIKSTLVEGLNTKLLGYKSLNPAYPDESTADQFFDAEQFDAYRELGYALCCQMLANGGKKYIRGDY